jgi:hypothetical protein
MNNTIKRLNAVLDTPTRKVIFTDDYPNLQKLVSEVGSIEASKLLGVTNVGDMINTNKVRPVYEMAASYILKEDNLQKDHENAVVLVIACTNAAEVAILPFLKFNGCKVTKL